MAFVVLVVHEERPEAVAQADALAAVLVGDGHQVNRSDDPGFTTKGTDLSLRHIRRCRRAI